MPACVINYFFGISVCYNSRYLIKELVCRWKIIRGRILFSFFKKLLILLRSCYYRFRASQAFFDLAKFCTNLFFDKKKIKDKPFYTNIVNQLVEHGAVVLPASDLFDGPELSILKQQAGNAEQIVRRAGVSNSKILGEKNYLTRYSESAGAAPLTDFLAVETITGRIYDIATLYFGSIPRITNIDYWLNVPEPEERAPFASQLWHRDYEDRKLLKFFMYFTDVDEGRGAFSLISQTHYGTTDAKQFPTKPPLGVTVSDKDVNAQFKEERIRKFEVPALTIVLVDTSALHRGGYCTSGERFLFTSTFTSFAGISPPLFSVPKSLFRVLDKSSNLSVTR